MRSTRPSFTILPTTSSMYVSEMSGIRAHKCMPDKLDTILHLTVQNLLHASDYPHEASLVMTLLFHFHPSGNFHTFSFGPFGNFHTFHFNPSGNFHSFHLHHPGNFHTFSFGPSGNFHTFHFLLSGKLPHLPSTRNTATRSEGGSEPRPFSPHNTYPIPWQTRNRPSP